MSQSDMIEVYREQGVFIDDRLIILTSHTSEMSGDESGTDVLMWKQFIANLDILYYFDRLAPITVRMNNVGGDWYHGMAIYGAILNSRAPITIQGYGPIMSIGSIIMQAGHRRLIDRNARMMLHYGNHDCSGHPKNVERHAEESKRITAEMEDIYLDQMMKKSPQISREEMRKELVKMIEFDYFIDARRVVSLGLADGFIPRPAPPRVRKQEQDESSSETPSK